MTTTESAYNEILDFLVSGKGPGAPLTFQPSAESRERVWSLIEREKSVGLSTEETAELNTYMQIEHLMRLAKARARLILDQNFGTAPSESVAKNSA